MRVSAILKQPVQAPLNQIVTMEIVVVIRLVFRSYVVVHSGVLRAHQVGNYIATYMYSYSYIAIYS